MSFIIKKGDTFTPLEAVLRDISGRVNLTGATVVFSMKSIAGVLKVNAQPATIGEQTISAGSVSYEWADDDVDTVGKYRGEFVATFPNGKSVTFPRGGQGLNQFIQIEIQGDV